MGFSSVVNGMSRSGLLPAGEIDYETKYKNPVYPDCTEDIKKYGAVHFQYLDNSSQYLNNFIIPKWTQGIMRLSVKEKKKICHRFWSL